MRTFLVVCVARWLLSSRPVVAFPVEALDVVLIKVGGSSITDKGSKETLDTDAIEWFARILSSKLASSFRQPSFDTPTNESSSSTRQCRSKKTAFVVVHGAGSFGHHLAKEFGLKGQTHPPSLDIANRTDSPDEGLHRRHIMQGVAKTRLSVQLLNRHVVSTFTEHGINAVSVSPFSMAMQAHGGDETAVQSLLSLVKSTLQAGLVPVLHGDACLYGNTGAGILSGDTIMEMLGKADWVSRVIFLTDVDGVFTKDPRMDPNARLLKTIGVDPLSFNVVSVDVEVSGSTHEHDVTGGLKVSYGLIGGWLLVCSLSYQPQLVSRCISLAWRLIDQAGIGSCHCSNGKECYDSQVRILERGSSYSRRKQIKCGTEEHRAVSYDFNMTLSIAVKTCYRSIALASYVKR